MTQADAFTGASGLDRQPLVARRVQLHGHHHLPFQRAGKGLRQQLDSGGELAESGGAGGVMKRGALLLVLLLAACSRGGVVMEQDGQGALFSTKGTAWGVWMERPANVDVGHGQVWSFGSVRLCLTSPALRPVLRSLEPVSVIGQAHVRLRVRDALRTPPDNNTYSRALFNDGYELSDERGAPRGLHEPNGWVVRNGCAGDRFTEIVVTITKTGPEGGGIDGIRVTYSLDGRLHEFTIPVGFGVCGTATKQHCPWMSR
jgi:hypothetical protein